MNQKLKEEYLSKLRTPEEAVQLVKSGDWAGISALAAEAVTLARS